MKYCATNLCKLLNVGWIWYYRGSHSFQLLPSSWSIYSVNNWQDHLSISTLVHHVTQLTTFIPPWGRHGCHTGPSHCFPRDQQLRFLCCVQFWNTGGKHRPWISATFKIQDFNTRDTNKTMILFFSNLARVNMWLVHVIWALLV